LFVAHGGDQPFHGLHIRTFYLDQFFNNHQMKTARKVFARRIVGENIYR
jgi:hypothetical protein